MMITPAPKRPSMVRPYHAGLEAFALGVRAVTRPYSVAETYRPVRLPAWRTGLEGAATGVDDFLKRERSAIGRKTTKPLLQYSKQR
jgi:hypothetical protein